MANDLNLFQAIGRLGRDPEIRTSNTGNQIANFSIACGSSWNDKQTGEKKEQTEWIRACAFGKLAEIIEKYLVKGSQVYISGKMQTRKWQDKEGNDKYTTEIVVNSMQMLGSKGDADGSRPPQSKPAPAQKQDDFDTDVPF